MLTPPPALAITAGQVDDFDANDSDNLGWGSPVGQTTSAVAVDGGQGGTGDNALDITFNNLSVVANTNGAGQWNGDWTAAGVAQISLDAMSPSSNPIDLTLWLGFAVGDPARGNGNVYVSSQSHTVLSNGAWHSIVFDVLAPDWLDVNGNDVVAALQSVDHFRILHNPSQGFLGDGGVGKLFIDNVTAIGVVPEPFSASLAIAAAAAACSCLGRPRRV